LDRLGQIMPGEKLQFSAVSLEEAHRALRQGMAHFEDVKRVIEGQE
jgi:allophanate hydrolase subunit 2